MITLVCLLCLDVVVSQHPTSSVSSVHSCLSNYLKMAPWREGGAGKGCHNFVCNDEEEQGVQYSSETEQSTIGDSGSGGVVDE